MDVQEPFSVTRRRTLRCEISAGGTWTPADNNINLLAIPRVGEQWLCDLSAEFYVLLTLWLTAGVQIENNCRVTSTLPPCHAEVAAVPFPFISIVIQRSHHTSTCSRCSVEGSILWQSYISFAVRRRSSNTSGFYPPNNYFAFKDLSFFFYYFVK